MSLIKLHKKTSPARLVYLYAQTHVNIGREGVEGFASFRPLPRRRVWNDRPRSALKWEPVIYRWYHNSCRNWKGKVGGSCSEHSLPCFSVVARRNYIVMTLWSWDCWKLALRFEQFLTIIWLSFLSIHQTFCPTLSNQLSIDSPSPH